MLTTKFYRTEFVFLDFASYPEMSGWKEVSGALVPLPGRGGVHAPQQPYLLWEETSMFPFHITCITLSLP